MHPKQAELWSAEPHPTPHIYPQLSPEQRSRLVLHLAFLMLKLVRNQPTLKTPLTPNQAHER